MLSDEFEDDETLLRAIPPVHWLQDFQRPSSAAFTPTTPGCSVDRDGGRGPVPAAKALSERRRLQGKEVACVVGIEKQACDTIGVSVAYAPEVDNEYHCELYNAPEGGKISKTKGRKLAETCSVVDLSSD